MNVSITVRHCTLPASTRRRVEDALRRLSRFHEGVAGAEVVFEKDSASILAEVRVQLAERGRGPLLARGRAATYTTALDDAIAKLARQAKRVRERRRRHRSPSSPVTVSNPIAPDLSKLEQTGPEAGEA